MKIKANDIKNTTPGNQNTTHQEFCYKAGDGEKRLGKILNEGFEDSTEVLRT